MKGFTIENKKDFLNIRTEKEFNSFAMDLFKYQAENVEVYKKFLKLLGKNPDHIKNISGIPFMPVTFFKSFTISDQIKTPEKVFTSSGTTGQETSKHLVYDLSVYNDSLHANFKINFGSTENYYFLALLPSYLERSGSSLVHMADELINASKHIESGFYLHNYNDLASQINSLKNKPGKIFILGVTFALLDFFEQYPMNIPDAIIMETGGMKGRKKEIVRTELHEILKSRTGASTIYSEYGMTELLSQAYSSGNGIFKTPPWMKIIITELHDPFAEAKNIQTGLINIIDLANIHSCAFIATQDLGRKISSTEFEVLGRMDYSELRGCNLMV